MSSVGTLFRIGRRSFSHGWEASYHHYKTLPRIAEWSWPFWNEAPQPTPVHVLVGRNNWPYAAWMLASWFQASEQTWPVVIHDDGTLAAQGREILQRLFQKARFISREEADAALGRVLHAYPFCQELRQKHPSSRKIFDAAHFTSGDHYLQFASNLLFFAHPREIMEWVKELPPECRLQHDCREASILTAAEMRDELGIKLWPRAHSGLSLIYKPAINLDLCDRALAQTSVLSGTPDRIEHTLTMLCAAALRRGGLLPARYSVSTKRVPSMDRVSQLYAGPASERLYAQELKDLLPVLMPVET